MCKQPNHRTRCRTSRFHKQTSFVASQRASRATSTAVSSVFGQPPWSRSVVRRGARSYVAAIQCQSRSSLVVSSSSDVVYLASSQISCAATTGERGRDSDSHRIRARLDGTAKMIWEDSAAVQSIQRPSHGRQTLSTLGMTVRAEFPEYVASTSETI
jgi:hypothetical protein